jgi:hypothetical protein
MDVSKLSAEQLTAGAELMGKTFENLQPMFKRGLNNVTDQMQVMSEMEMKQALKDKETFEQVKTGWNEALAMQARRAMSPWVALKGSCGHPIKFWSLDTSTDPGAAKDDEGDIAAQGKRNQEKLNARLAVEAAVRNAPLQAELDQKAKIATLAKTEEEWRNLAAMHA